MANAPSRQSHVLEPAVVKAHRRARAHAAPREPDHVLAGIDRIDAQPLGDQCRGQQTGPASDFNDRIAGAQPATLHRGLDQLRRIARALAVVLLGDAVEHLPVAAAQLRVADPVSGQTAPP